MTKYNDDALNLFVRFAEPCLINGNPVEGVSVSWMKSLMRENGWRRLGNFNDFETSLEEAGFTVKEGRLQKGNRPARIVHL